MSFLSLQAAPTPIGCNPVELVEYDTVDPSNLQEAKAAELYAAFMETSSLQKSS
jgi:hypothetical protein